MKEHEHREGQECDQSHTAICEESEFRPRQATPWRCSLLTTNQESVLVPGHITCRKEFLRGGQAQARLTEVLLKVDVRDLPGFAQLSQDLGGIAVDLLK